MKKVDDPKEKERRKISFRLSGPESKKFQVIQKLYPNWNDTEIVKHRLFNHRSRAKLKMTTVDLVFLGTLANTVSCLLSDARRGVDIVPHAIDLQNMLNEKLGK